MFVAFCFREKFNWRILLFSFHPANVIVWTVMTIFNEKNEGFLRVKINCHFNLIMKAMQYKNNRGFLFKTVLGPVFKIVLRSTRLECRLQDCKIYTKADYTPRQTVR